MIRVFFQKQLQPLLLFTLKCYFMQPTTLTFESLQFKNGVALIKSGRKIKAKVYDRFEFHKDHLFAINKKYPFSIEVNGGAFECVDNNKWILNTYPFTPTHFMIIKLPNNK